MTPAGGSPLDLLGAPLTIGVELGRGAVKVVAVRRGARPRLVHAAISPMPAGVIEGGMVLALPLAVDTLRAALRQAGIRRGRAVIGISGRNVIVRHLPFPPMPADELKSAIRLEAERHLPLRIDEAVLDAQVLREVTEDGQKRIEVLMAAVPERDALAYHQAAAGAGLDVAAIEAASLALVRTLDEDPGPIAGVDVGADITEIVIARHTLPLVCRSFPVGRDHITSAGLMRTAEPSADASASPGPGLQDLLDGVARSFDYFQAQARQERIARVVLSGDGALTPGLAQLLAGELAVPVAVGDPLARLAISPQISLEVLDQRAAFAIAVGLALRTLT